MENKVIIADDHPIFRMGVREIVHSIHHIQLVAEASNGMEAYQLILANLPRLAILDLEMPLLSGLDVCKKVKAEKHQTDFIILTMHREKHFFTEAMHCGVMGYLLKDNAGEDLVQCIHDVLQGKVFVSPAIETYLTEHQGVSSSEANKVAQNLTPTEKVILKLISEGKTSQEIAGMLFVSPNTVDNHRGNMTRKLGLEGKHALMKFALQLKGNL